MIENVLLGLVGLGRFQSLTFACSLGELPKLFGVDFGRCFDMFWSVLFPRPRHCLFFRGYCHTLRIQETENMTAACHVSKWTAAASRPFNDGLHEESWANDLLSGFRLTRKQISFWRTPCVWITSKRGIQIWGNGHHIYTYIYIYTHTHSFPFILSSYFIFCNGSLLF